MAPVLGKSVGKSPGIFFWEIVFGVAVSLGALFSAIRDHVGFSLGSLRSSSGCFGGGVTVSWCFFYDFRHDVAVASRRCSKKQLQPKL